MLNDQQKAAVEHKNGPILVVAGAGTGKTRVITERIAHLIDKDVAKPHEILALTFTEKAAAEMEVRLDELLPIGHETLQVSTFHAFCEKMLRQYGIDIGLSPSFKILQGVAQWKFLKDRLFDFELNYYRPSGNPTKFIDSLVTFFSRLKEELITVEQFESYAEKSGQGSGVRDQSNLKKGDLPQAFTRGSQPDESRKWLELSKAYKKYQELMLSHDYLDFSDLQFKLIELLTKRPNILTHLQNRYRYILVDEYQDTNIAQNKIVDLLAVQHQNLMVVGDDDQSIYKFRGAAISNILQFEEKYPHLKKVVLVQNYRSNQKILDFAYASIQNNNPNRLEIKSQINKKLIGQSEGAEDSIKLVHCSTIEQEVNYVIEEIKLSKQSLSEMAILVRANSYARPFVEALKKENIPYQFLSERGLYNKEEIKELICLLRIIANPSDEVSFFRVLRMEYWNLPMLMIIQLIDQSKKKYQTLWKVIQAAPETAQLSSMLLELIEYSKKHTVGEVLYHFTQSLKLYETFLQKNTIEAEEQITNIASFFGRIREFERESDEVSVMDFVRYLDLAEEAGENPAARFDAGGVEGVQISTIHGAKGLEFETVFLPSLVARRFPSDDRKDPIEMPSELIHEILTEGDFHLQEERRLFYVAVTRAKEHLHLLNSDFYNSSNSQNPRPKKPSIFLKEIENKVSLLKIEKTIEGVEKFLKPAPLNLPISSELGKRLPIYRFSHSALSTFKNCPRQYEYAYILKIPTPPSGAASFGSSLHITLDAFYKLVNQSKQASLFEEYQEDLSLERLLSIFEEKWILSGYDSIEHMKALKKRGRDILANFYEHFKNEIPRIEFLEKSFKLKIGQYTISGRMDRADRLPDGTLEVIDYKSGKSRSQKEVDNDEQLMIYALATQACFDKPASKLTLYFLDDDLKVTTTPDSKKLEKMKEGIIKAANEVNQSSFPPDPSKFKCGFCPFNKICDAAEI